jgi:hypothetical protein
MLHFVPFIFALQIAPPTSLNGVVVNAATKEPIARASVALINVNGSPGDARLVTSGNEGQFNIPGLPAGRYSVVVTRAGYIRFVYGQRAPNEPAGIIEVRDGQRLEDIRVEMIPTGVISGRVFSPEGERQGDVTVRALKATYRDGQRSMSIVKEAQTNDLGEYRLAGLTPGSYILNAFMENPVSLLSSAAEVTTGNSGIENVQLILHKPLTLSGRVKIEGRLQSDNDPSVSRLRLTLNSQFNPGGLIADVRPDGTFAFTGTSGLVPNESYQLRFIELTPQKNYYLKAAAVGSSGRVIVKPPTRSRNERATRSGVELKLRHVGLHGD